MKDTETDICSAHTLKYRDRFLQKKGHCETKDYIP
jgi:hypothetical protein